jgi:hypothetical protein
MRRNDLFPPLTRNAATASAIDPIRLPSKFIKSPYQLMKTLSYYHAEGDEEPAFREITNKTFDGESVQHVSRPAYLTDSI